MQPQPWTSNKVTIPACTPLQALAGGTAGGKGTPTKQRRRGLDSLAEDTTVAKHHAGALQDHNVDHAVCNHHEHEPEQKFVASLTTEPVPISQASSSTCGVPCSQQQPPDGHASTWTEPTCELSQLGRTPQQGKLQWVLKRSFLKRNGPDIRPSYCPDRPRTSFRR